MGLMLALGVAVGGCHGDDSGESASSSTSGSTGPEIAELEGFWRMHSIEAEIDDTGGPMAITATRDGARGIRGNAEFIILTGDEATFHVRYALLQDGLPDRLPTAINAAVALDGDHLLVSPVDAGAHVYAVARGDLSLTLTFDPADPRNEPGTPTLPRTMEMRRLPLPSRDPAGTWRLLSMTLPGGEVVNADSCVAADGGLWASYTYGLDVDRYYGFERKTSVDLHEDEFCDALYDSVGDFHAGVAEEEGDRLRTWLFREEGSGLLAEAAEYGMNRVDDEMTLALEGCEPRPECEANLPLSVTVVLTGL